MFPGGRRSRPRGILCEVAQCDRGVGEGRGCILPSLKLRSGGGGGEGGL